MFHIHSINPSNSHHLEAIKRQDFTYGLEILTPINYTINQSLFSYSFKAPLSFFISPEFIDVLKSKSIITALSINTRLDHDNVFAILPSGTLLLNISRNTYETLGLEGIKSPQKDRFIIQIDLKHESFKHGTKLYDRAKWCFQNTLTDSFEFYISSVDSNGSNFQLSFENLELISQSRNHIFKNIKTPLFELLNFDLNTNSGLETATELFEWIGMVLNDSPRLNVSDSPDPYISYYSVPEPYAPLDIYSHSIIGLLSKETILHIVKDLEFKVLNNQLDWFCLSRWGFRDSYGVGGQAGEDDISILLTRSGGMFCQVEC